MPHRFRGVLDLVRETDRRLAAARVAAREALGAADPLDRTSRGHRVMTLIANAQTSNDAVRTALMEHAPPPSPSEETAAATPPDEEDPR